MCLVLSPTIFFGVFESEVFVFSLGRRAGMGAAFFFLGSRLTPGAADGPRLTFVVRWELQYVL